DLFGALGMSVMPSVQHFVSNGEGWLLSLNQAWDPARLHPRRMPVLIVPGYGMNSFVFGYHRHGRSFEASLVEAGFEVWRVDLRAQGPSKRAGGGRVFGLQHLARTDLGAAIAAALDRTKTRASVVAIIGASLGATLMFGHAALAGTARIGALVAIGGPVRWVRVHPLLRVAFASPTLVGLVPVRGSRAMARVALPHLLARAPSLLSIYMNAAHVDPSNVDELSKTVEDPSRHVNRQIAEWIARRDLVLDGVDVTAALPGIRAPFLSVAANADGIVPRETTEYTHERIGSRDRQHIVVGTPTLAFGHADVFTSDHSEEHLYRPVRDWLLERT
ncbi:MAG: alpha/beta fold hydrolase, partial [Polyangiaceae bacterium]